MERRPTPIVVAHPHVLVVVVRPVAVRVVRREIGADVLRGGHPHGAVRRIVDPRPVRVESVTHVGKEIIVDPTDTAEDLTAEELAVTAQVEYHDVGAFQDALRARIKAAGISRVAKVSGVSRSTVQAFVNRGGRPHSSTIAKLLAALH